MSDNWKLHDALDARFFAPLRRTRTRRVGIELEFPVWNLTPGAAPIHSSVLPANTWIGSRKANPSNPSPLTTER